MINRAALILKYKQPAIDWINHTGAKHEAEEDLSAGDINSDRNVYLIADDIADNPETLDEWLQMNLQTLFESELEEWHPDPELWPKHLNYSLFQQWFDVECHTILVDTLNEPIEDDGI